ncbi:MAG: hypothetical protein JEZ06_21365 [Anaerolineaceae bacterium]|nr:hypothetical protein [Anaerolineaceae bacterium]
MMKRFGMLLLIEFKLAAATIPFHLVAILQPSLMFVLMAAILVNPTFEMNVAEPQNEAQQDYVDAMLQVGSPIGEAYIDPTYHKPEAIGSGTLGQVIVFEERNKSNFVVQQFSLIDSNMVKNYRNRQTAAGLILWNQQLGALAVDIQESPWLPVDMPYTIYFSMALLPMATCIAGALVGGVLTAHDFEFNTIFEYRLAPVSTALMLSVRIVRAALTALISATILLIISMLYMGFVPRGIGAIYLILLPMALIASCLGIAAALIFRKTIPAFVIGLAATFGFWIMGSGFGLAGGFSGLYEQISRFIPNTYAVELLFPHYYGTQLHVPSLASMTLVFMCLLMLALVTILYTMRVRRRV